jgi:ribose-phosphate pyrophosphokinase
MICLNGTEIKFSHFPNGETHVPDIDPTNLADGSPHKIDFSYESDDDLLHLWFLAHHLEWNRCLYINYLPYSRMDRKVGNSVFTLRAVVDLINKMAFHSVKIVEPHSDVATQLIARSEALMVSSYLVPRWVMPEIEFNTSLDWLVFPDEGAQKRYGGVDGPIAPTLVGNKTRDFQTGKITGLTISTPACERVNGESQALIWDDLCSRGGTFMSAGQQLKDMGFGRVVLYVTHMEQTVLDGPLLDDDSPIDAVYCTDTMPWVNTWYVPKLHVFHQSEALAL